MTAATQLDLVVVIKRVSTLEVFFFRFRGGLAHKLRPTSRQEVLVGAAAHIVVHAVQLSHQTSHVLQAMLHQTETRDIDFFHLLVRLQMPLVGRFFRCELAQQVEELA